MWAEHGRRPRRALAILLTALCAYAGLEVAWRGWRYLSLTRTRQLARLRVLDAPLVRFDPQLGYRYVPSRTVRQFTLDTGFQVVRMNRIAVNAQGWISRRPYPTAPDRGQFRIAVFGDSFAACTFSEVTWPDSLEDVLAAAPAESTLRPGREVRVLNFGMDATGAVQWPRVADVAAGPLEPDLWLVAFIEADLWRDFKWMATVRPRAEDSFQLQLVSEEPTDALDHPATQLSFRIVVPDVLGRSPSERESVVRSALRRRIDVLPWRSPRPELALALLVEGGVRLPPALRPRLHLRAAAEERRGDPERLARATVALASFRERPGEVLLVHVPTREEVIAGRVADSVAALPPSLGIVSLLPELAAESESVREWFHSDNGHLTDAGAVAYAHAVAELLKRLRRRAVTATSTHPRHPRAADHVRARAPGGRRGPFPP